MNRQSSIARLAFLLLTPIILIAMYADISAAIPTPVLQFGSPFSDHMVLQRGKPVAVWGWDTPGQDVTVYVAGEHASATAGDDGRWLVMLPPLEVGGPYRLVARGSSEVALIDVVVGEVWLASGQSNMEWSLSWIPEGDALAADTANPDIRLLKIPRTSSTRPEHRVATQGWKAASPEVVKGFSAVAFFACRDLQAHLGVPVGVIDCSWGGSSMESWTSREALSSDPGFAPALEQFEEWSTTGLGSEAHKAEVEAAMAEWRKVTGGQDFHSDPGDNGRADGWHQPDFDDISWESADLPGAWEKSPVGDIDGVVWYRRAVDLPADWAGAELNLELGRVDDFEVAFFNGREVGATGAENPNAWATPRRYTVPAGVARAGGNVVAIRVFDRVGDGGVLGDAEGLFVAPTATPDAAVSLAGTWRYRVAVALPPRPRFPDPQPNHVPTVLYNGMVHPLLPFTVRGLMWYQGETNSNERARLYYRLSKLMLRDWRERFGQGDLPFILAQLAAWTPASETWLWVRQAQFLMHNDPTVGVVVTADNEDITDIHPRDKLPVAKRFYRWILKLGYGEELLPCGPLYRSTTAEGKALRLAFDYAKGLSATGGELTGFELAGADERFVAAEARFEGETIVVVSDEIEAPKFVRYGWKLAPELVLTNATGIPAPPFTTVPIVPEGHVNTR